MGRGVSWGQQHNGVRVGAQQDREQNSQGGRSWRCGTEGGQRLSQDSVVEGGSFDS